MKYAIIDKLVGTENVETTGTVSLRKACKLMNARRQGYYEYLWRKGSKADYVDRLLTAKIKDVFYESKRIYGARKTREKLREMGTTISHKRIRRFMQTAGLIPVVWRKSVRTTVADPNSTPFPNLLKQDFRVALPDKTWVSDFTYIPTDEDRLYLCTFIDLFSRRVIG